MENKNIHLGESFLDRLIKDTYNKNSLGDLSTEQMNELNAYIKSDDFKTKSQKFKSTDRTKFEGSMDYFFGKNTEKSRFYQNSLANPDKTKYLIPRLTTGTIGTDDGSESTVVRTATGTQATGTTVTGTSTTSSTTGAAGAAGTTGTGAATTGTEAVSSTVGASNGTATVQSTRQKPQRFNFDQFASDQKLTDVETINGKKYVRYDPHGFGDFYVDQYGKIYIANLGGGVGKELTSVPIGLNYGNQYKRLKELLTKYKQGGTMNRINYFEQGGRTPQQEAQDMQQQIVALVQAAMQGDEKANQTVNQIMEAAKQGDQQAVQLAQMIQAVVQQMKGQAVSAKWGSKLAYIRSLKYAKGGKSCAPCKKRSTKKVEEKACGGKSPMKVQEKACGGKTSMKVEEKACGGKAKKAKKRYFGGWL